MDEKKKGIGLGLLILLIIRFLAALGSYTKGTVVPLTSPAPTIYPCQAGISAYDYAQGRVST